MLLIPYNLMIRVRFARYTRCACSRAGCCVVIAKTTCPHCNIGCSAHEFSCLDGMCVSASLRCNFVQDCIDGSDELDCPGMSCWVRVVLCGVWWCIVKRGIIVAAMWRVGQLFVMFYIFFWDFEIHWFLYFPTNIILLYDFLPLLPLVGIYIIWFTHTSCMGSPFPALDGPPCSSRKVLALLSGALLPIHWFVWSQNNNNNNNALLWLFNPNWVTRGPLYIMLFVRDTRGRGRLLGLK